MRRLLDQAARPGATPATTPKDAVRMPTAMRQAITIVGVRPVWADPAALESLFDGVLRGQG